MFGVIKGISMNFASLDLAPDLQKGIDACGYKKMTPVQEQAIIPARQGKDILAIAQTGTGKTAAFAIPILQRMTDSATEQNQTNPRALILTPTRELAEQLARTIGAYAEFLPLKVGAVFGGTKLTGEASKLKAGIDVLIATPGRLLEHIVERNVTLTEVEYVVLDESDRMLDMGFISDVQTILQRTRKKRQTSLFSATLSPAVNELSHKILHNHIEIRTTKVNTAAETVEHVVYPVEERRKIDLFKDLLAKHNWYQVLVFTSTTHQADKLQKALREEKVSCAVCHGDKRQNARRRALADFRSAKIQVLIATEVAARGLDIPDLDFVLNYNLPYLAEDYVHRIGRTGRAGKKGYAISFVSREEERTLESIQRLIGTRIKRITQDDFEVSDRDPLINKVSQQKRSGRLNKAGSTTIDKS
ncbi:MAG: superfamily II DNA/RNA helicase [Arenicella sp.]|jgi:superfamily II DNA/RNA helicase